MIHVVYSKKRVVALKNSLRKDKNLCDHSLATHDTLDKKSPNSKCENDS